MDLLAKTLASLSTRVRHFNQYAAPAPPTLRRLLLLLLVVDGDHRQLGGGYEVRRPRDILPDVPQSNLVRPEEGARKRSQGQRRPPAEGAGEGAAAASVGLHRLYGLEGRSSD